MEGKCVMYIVALHEMYLTTSTNELSDSLWREEVHYPT